MCGVTAAYAYHPAAGPVNRDAVRRLRDAMQSRGPDDQGEWWSSDGSVGLGHRRLAILDPSSRGHQPMTLENAPLALSFNGEIYNFRELRRELESEGISFRTQTDTEVVLRLFQRDGIGMLNRLRGMFAVALWDGVRRELFLARDPYGIKPLYYRNDGWRVWVSSQAKPLRSCEKPVTLDPAGVVGFCLTGSVPEPFTLHREIRSLPAGSWMRVGPHGASAPVRYFSLSRCLDVVQESQPPEVVREAVADAVRNSVQQHLVSDAPLGAFLSAGIDSSSLVGMASEAQSPLQTLTLGFPGTAGDESAGASEVARTYSTDHTCVGLEIREFSNQTPALLEAMDLPSIDGANVYFLSKAAAERGWKVVLSGLGGDELFAGYPSFRDVPRWVKWARSLSWIPGLSAGFRHTMEWLKPRGVSPKLAGMLTLGSSYAGAYFLRRGLFLPWELPQILDPDLTKEGLARLNLQQRLQETLQPDPGTANGRVTTLESSFYLRNQLLRDADWAAMAHSLELRVPFVDAWLLRQLAPWLSQFSHGEGKRYLAAAPQRPLPSQVVNRPKTGFTLPLARWIQQDDQWDAWKRVAALRDPNCPWARRWAFTLIQRELAA